ncbi:MAG: SRPBCC family protein [Planctomycetota bacterium]|jgi:hypothetical protein
MMQITVRKRVSANVNRVFEAFTDFANAAENVSGITRVVMLTDGEVGNGTRFRETRVMFKREATEEMAVTDFDRPSRYTLTCTSCGAEYASTFHFNPDGEATEVEMVMAVRPITLAAKLMSPLSRLMTGPLVKCVERDIDDIAKIVEGTGQVT